MSCPSWQKYTTVAVGPTVTRSLVQTLPLLPNAFACWWCPCGVTWDAAPEQSWHYRCSEPPPSNIQNRAMQLLDRDNFNLDSTHQEGQLTSKERNTGEHRELQADGGQGWKRRLTSQHPQLG